MLCGVLTCVGICHLATQAYTDTDAHMGVSGALGAQRSGTADGM